MTIKENQTVDVTKLCCVPYRNTLIIIKKKIILTTLLFAVNENEQELNTQCFNNDVIYVDIIRCVLSKTIDDDDKKTLFYCTLAYEIAKII